MSGDSPSRVLVTGGCGFIGVHVVRRLVECGYEVGVLDDMSAGDPQRLGDLVGSGLVKLFRGDVADRGDVARVMSEVAPWGVVHLAAPVSVAESKVDPDKYFRVIVDGTRHVLVEAGVRGVRRIVNLNSAAVYGRASITPTAETHPAQPTNPYGVAKYVGEQLVIHAGRVLGIGVVSLRLMNLYGEHSSALFGLFMRQARAGEPLTVTGDGSQRRDFTYVGDVAIGIVAALESDVDGMVLNFGTGETMSVLEMAGLFGAPIKFIERASDEPDVIHGTIDELRRHLPLAVPRTRPEDVVPGLVRQIE